MLGRIALWLLCVSAPAFAAPPYKHYVLAPEHLSGDLSVLSLEPNNAITTGTVQRNLGEFETATIPASELPPGTIITGTAQYSVGSSVDATDLLAPDFFAGTAFVIPHITGSHKYYVQATVTTANLTIQLGGTTDALQINPGTSYEIDAGSDNGIAGRITSDQPIVVAHVAYVSGAPRDAYAVPPASTELVGIRSQSVVLGANTNGTSVTVYTSDATSTTYSLNAGEKVAVAIGGAGAQGAGASIHITSNHPVSAVQYDDGDGNDATAFWPVSAFSRRYGIPVDSQYVAVACLQSGVTVTLFKGAGAPETQTCSASGNDPGKVYFGAGTGGSNVSKGWFLRSSAPVYVMYEVAASEDEHNLSGAQSSAGPSAPTLATVTSPTTSNPLAISGTAPANLAVRLYVNGVHQQTTTASGGGAYSFNAELFDGNNVLHVVAVSAGGDESDPSNVEQVVYNNTVSRTQSGALSGSHVWTPGSPATPYVVSATLTVAAGSKLVLQPGTTLRFANGASLTVNGTLKIAGTAQSMVTLTSNAASPTKGIWPGIVLNATAAGSEIAGALIEWAANGIRVNGAAVTIRGNTIRNFSANGVYVSGAASSGTLIQANLIDNLNDTVNCIQVEASSATVQGNTLTNCDRGVYVIGASTSAVSGNLISGNDYGLYVAGSSGLTAQPVVTGNRIFSSDNNNYIATGFGSGGSVVRLNATGNWWGSADPTTIAGTISDLSDSTGSSQPTVDYSFYLDAAGGDPVPGNYLNGKLTSSLSLTAGAVYEVLGAIFVNPGVSLTIPAGTTLRFHSNAYLIVDGTLTVQGTSGNLVTLTSGRTAPARGNWTGVSIRAGSGSVVEYALMEWAVTGVGVTATTVTIRNNTIRNFSSNGVHVSGTATSGSLIQNNLIDNLNDTVNCVQLETSSATVQGNTLTNCDRGVYVIGASTAAVSGNLITSNDYGLYVSGSSGITAQPVVTGNQILASDNFNYIATSFGSGGSGVRLNATGNWWGSTDPTTIAGAISDLSDSVTSSQPTVDYSGYLDGPGGSPIGGNVLNGRLATSSSLTAGAVYEVQGTTFVNPGVTLTIPAGTTLRFHSNAYLIVDGTLNVQGTSVNPVTLTSGRAVPARGNWTGVSIRAGSGSVVEHALIEWAVTGVGVSGTTATIRNNTIRNFSANGVHVSGAATSGSLIQNNVIDNLNDTVNCVQLETSSATVQGNTLTNCDRGVYVIGASTAAVSGNLITSNDYGLYVSGSSGITAQPVVTGNRILISDNFNYIATSFGAGGSGVRLNATGNWWGSTDPTTIAATISDLSDSFASSLPTVDYSGYLDGPAGTPVGGNFLLGKLDSSSTLIAGAVYEVLGTTFVNAGVTLTIPAGATLRFHSNAFLVVDGTLTVQGTSGNPVTLTSGRTAPARGNWTGVSFRGGSGSVIEYALIEWAVTGVGVTGAGPTIRNNTIRNFSTNGVHVSGAAASGTLVQNNLIDNLNDTGNCIQAEASSPTIQGNTLTNCDRGVYVIGAGAAAVNGNNIITGNDYGIYVSGSSGITAQPVVTGNQILASDNFNYIATSFGSGGSGVKLNATGNWWGSADPTTIAATISDLSDTYTSSQPTVDYSGYLDGPGGNPAGGNFLIGKVASSGSLTAGAVYEVIGTTFVNAGVTLTIPAGTTLRFHGNAFLVVDGTLAIQGTASSRVRLTSGRPAQARGDWAGILVRSTATSTLIEYALIEWATRGVDVQSTNAIIRHSIIRNFSTAGIAMTGSGASSEITGNYIDNFNKAGDGIVLSAASPSITGNRIQRTNRGIYMSGASNPTVTGNILTENNWGIYLDGNNSNSATAVPRPTITGNDIFGNTNAQLEVFDYGTTNPAVITATGNWWGTATPVSGTHIKFSSGTPTGSVDFSSPASGPLNGTVAASLTVSEAFFSPNGDAVKDITTIQATLSQSSSWTLTIRTAGGAAVRTYSGSGTSIVQAWDGRDGASTVQPDGVYDCDVSVPGPMVIGFCTTTVDSTPPVPAIVSPAASSTLQNVISVPVNGSAADPLLVSYTLAFGAGASPSSYTTIQTQAAGVSNGLLGTWVVSSTTGGAAVPSGLYTLRLSASDRAGNAGVVTVPVTIDNISVGTVTQNLELIRPMQSEQLQIGFTLCAPGTAHLRIYPEQGGALVKQVSETFTTAGAKTLSWDGRNTVGAFVTDEAYSYTLFIDDGVRTALYDPPDAGTVGSGTGTVDASYNATRNDFWKMNYTLTAPKGRVRMQVSSCGITGTHMVYDWVPFLPGTFPVIWDGRDQFGQLVTGTCEIYFDAPDPLKLASVIVKGTVPKVTGNGASPNIEVKSNPYKATHSYEQVSKITYRVDQDSFVTVKLLPPGISDFANPEAIVLVNNQLRNALSGGSPLDHAVEWKGYDTLDTNNILVSNEGTYTFAIQATGAVSGITTLYRGALQLYQ